MSSHLNFRAWRVAIYASLLSAVAILSIHKLGTSAGDAVTGAAFENVPSCPGAVPVPSEAEPFPIRYKLTKGDVSTFQIDMWERCEAEFAGYVERFPGKMIFQLSTPDHMTGEKRNDVVFFCDCPHSFRYKFDGELKVEDEVLFIHHGDRIVVNADEF